MGGAGCTAAEVQARVCMHELGCNLYIGGQMNQRRLDRIGCTLISDDVMHTCTVR